jgi:UrcA family protein
MFDRHARSSRILLSAALLLTAIPLAAGAAETRSVAVRVGDLNLDSDAGRTVLRRRIDLAVETICGDVHMRASWEARAAAISCSNTARASAMPQFDALVAAAQSGRKVATDNGKTLSVR